MFSLKNSNVNFETMKMIALSCTKITHLGLGSCKYISNEMITMISENCKYLEQISFPNCSALGIKNAMTKNGRDGKIIGPSLFGVAINSFAINHNSTNCNKEIINPYTI